MLIRVLIIFLSLLASNYRLFNEPKALRYRNWYRPWLYLIIALLAFVFRPNVHEFLSRFFPSLEYAVEISFCISVLVLWIACKYGLQLIKANDTVEAFLQQYNSSDYIEKRRGFSNYLLWPYFIDHFKIFNRPGRAFIRILFWVATILVILAYLWSVVQLGEKEFILPNGLGLIILPFFIEWIIYLSCNTTEKVFIPEKSEDEEKPANFYQLFKRYINPEKGFYNSVLFGFVKHTKRDRKLIEEQNQSYIKSIVDRFQKDGQDFIVSTDDFLQSIPQFNALFFEVMKKGGNALILLDMPSHTRYKADDVGIQFNSFTEFEPVAKLFAKYLEQTLEEQVPSSKELFDIGYFDQNDRSGLSKRILLTTINDALNDELIHSEWLQELDLVFVVQLSDGFENNLLEKRRLSLWLDEQGIDFDTVLFKLFRTSGDEAITNTWLMDRNPQELKLETIPVAKQNFCINFAAENSPLNIDQIFRGNIYDQDFSPGIELAVPAIMEDIKHVHFFEGFQLDYFQAKNKLETAQSRFVRYDSDPEDEYNYGQKVTQAKIKDAIEINNLPFIVREQFSSLHCEERHLSIVFDSINNAPKLYKKYCHLGEEESFICLVSKPHLFREFFAEQLHYFIDNTLDPLEPELSKANINLCLQLYYLLMHEHIDLQYIRYLISQHGVYLKDQSVVAFITKLFKDYLHLDSTNNSFLKSTEFYQFNNGQYQLVQQVTIDESEPGDDIQSYLQQVNVVDSSRNILLSLPKYLLFQNFLPQQNIIINGTSYAYNNFDPGASQLILEATPTATKTFYKPDVQIQITTPSQPERNVDVIQKKSYSYQGKQHAYSLGIYEREMHTSFSKYYQFSRYYHSSFAKEQSTQVIHLDHDDLFMQISGREYLTRYVHLHWEIPPELYERVAELTTSIHILLYEFLPVLFPHRHQYLHVCSNNQFQTKQRRFVPWIFPTHNFTDQTETAISIFIVEDSFSDLGLLKAIQTNFNYIIKHLHDLILWMKDEKSSLSHDFSEYVRGQQFYDDKLQFLRYGLLVKEMNWDLDLLLHFIKTCAVFDTTTLDRNHKKRSAQVNQSVEVECDYCARKQKLAEVQIMEDGLHRCMSCSQNAIDHIAEARELEKIAKQLYKEHLGISFEQQALYYELELISATELHRRFNKPFSVTNQYDERKAIGIAEDDAIDVIHIEKHRQPASTLATIIHEMMHIYQFQVLNFFKMDRSEQELIEGMTTWAEVFLLQQSGIEDYIAYANRREAGLLEDESEYGVGFRYVTQRYGETPLAQIVKKYKKAR